MAKSLSKKQFYLRCLWLPFAAPIVALPLAFVPYIGVPFQIMVMIGGYGLLFGGIQYALIIGILYYFKLRHMTGDQLQRFSWVLPLIYTAVAALIFVIYELLKKSVNPLEGAFAAFGVIGIPLSYFYVLLAHGLYKLLVWRKVIKQVEE